MRLAVKCKRCRQWGFTETSDPKKAVFLCKVCGLRRKLMNAKYEWNMYIQRIPYEYNEVLAIQQLNEKEAST